MLRNFSVRSIRNRHPEYPSIASCVRVKRTAHGHHVPPRTPHVSPSSLHPPGHPLPSLSPPFIQHLSLSVYPKPWRGSQLFLTIEALHFAGWRRRRALPPPRPPLPRRRPRGRPSPSFSFLFFKPQARRTSSSCTKPSPPSSRPYWCSTGRRWAHPLPWSIPFALGWSHWSPFHNWWPRALKPQCMLDLAIKIDSPRSYEPLDTNITPNRGRNRRERTFQCSYVELPESHCRKVRGADYPGLKRGLSGVDCPECPNWSPECPGTPIIWPFDSHLIPLLLVILDPHIYYCCRSNPTGE